MIEVSSFKKGQCLLYKGAPVIVIEVQFTTPTARGASPIAKTKLRNLLTGQQLNESLRTSDKYEEVDVERRPCSYLYADGTHHHFMDAESFEQFQLAADDLGGSARYLVDGLEGARALVIEGQVVSLELPNTVEQELVECDPAIKGATATAQLKRAVTETGLEVQVPPYLELGQRIRIDTRDGHFVERVKG